MWGWEDLGPKAPGRQPLGPALQARASHQHPFVVKWPGQARRNSLTVGGCLHWPLMCRVSANELLMAHTLLCPVLHGHMPILAL